jgi:hypothetical protein
MTRLFRRMPLLTRALERSKAFTKRFHHRDLLAERAAGDIAVPSALRLRMSEMSG